MAEFTEVMRQAQRLCAAHIDGDCALCPLFGVLTGCKGNVCNACDTKEIQNIVFNWAAEHPEPVYPTWREWQNANFPNADSIIHPCVFESEEYFNCVNKNSCECCENERIPADIAEKLGVKPIDNKGGAGK